MCLCVCVCVCVCVYMQIMYVYVYIVAMFIMLSQDIYDHLPRQQRLNEDEWKEAEDCLKMKVDNNLLQQHLSDKTGKVVT